MKLERAHKEDAGLFTALERTEDTKQYVIPYSLNKHEQGITDPNLVYLRIVSDDEIVGYFILALENDSGSVEFRRIVVANKGQGIGQLAIREMEKFCKGELGRDRIWLDVFENNYRGRHVYEKLGYIKFGESSYEGRTLHLYQKYL